MRFLTAGESHGPGLTGIIEGLPAGFSLKIESIDSILSKRQQGYGRGSRMSIEQDKVKIISGMRFGKTLGTPLTLIIENKDWENWQEAMQFGHSLTEKAVTRPRPGHADLPGGIKYQQRDLRNILERASARETAMRTAIGAVAAQLLAYFRIEILSYVLSVGDIRVPKRGLEYSSAEINKAIERSILFCPDEETEKKMCQRIDRAREEGDTLGGTFEIVVSGVPPGLGSHVHWDRRLDGRLAAALMSIPGIKGVEIGLGFAAAQKPGSLVHDPIVLGKNGNVCRPSNNAGGIEGGISNGENLVIRAAMKPVPTLLQPLFSIDLAERKNATAAVERSDICAVPAASVVGGAVVAWEVARAFMEKFAGDSMVEVEQSYKHYLRLKRNYLGE